MHEAIVQPVVVVQEEEEVQEAIVQPVVVVHEEEEVQEAIVQPVVVVHEEAEVQEQAPPSPPPNLVPNSREVRQSVHQSITRAQGEAVLEHWMSSNQHMTTLNETLVDMIKSYQNRCAPDQIHDMLTYMPSINARCDCLIGFIKRRHQLPEDDMLKGIELFRTYSEAFGTNAQVHL